MPPEPTILAFDTAAAHCAAVLVQGDTVLASCVEPMTKGQAERLFPMLEEMLSGAGLSWADLSAIGVGTGPGNFTGIRISVSAARGLALSLGKPAIGISRMEAMVFGTKGTQLAAVDARQNRLYIQSFANGTAQDDIQIVDASDFEPQLPVLSDAPVACLSNVVSTETALVNAATIAARRMNSPQPRPAPLYVRAPDAALPSDPPPTILP